MYLTALSQKKDIDKATKSLIALLSQGANRGCRVIGHQGGGFEATLYYHKKYDFWSAFFMHDDATVPRHWFGYGLGDPKDLYHITPICETNIPMKGTDRRIGGAFARDEYGSIYLVHSGKIGGGRKGIGLGAFWEHYFGDPVNILYPPNNKIYGAAQIGKLGSKNLLGLIADFVRQVDRVKQLPTQNVQHLDIYLQEQSDPELSSIYSPEYQGKKAPYNVNRSVEANCYHGRVVDVLNAKLADFNPVNDQKRDLYIKSAQGKIDSLFEIKTDCLWQSIYTGIGQLFINSDSSTRNRFLVIYAPETNELANKLEQIGITIVPYVWDDEQVVFTAFDDLLKILAHTAK